MGQAPGTGKVRPPGEKGGRAGSWLRADRLGLYGRGTAADSRGGIEPRSVDDSRYRSRFLDPNDLVAS
jgi:hypothetical protein